MSVFKYYMFLDCTSVWTYFYVTLDRESSQFCSGGSYSVNTNMGDRCAGGSLWRDNEGLDLIQIWLTFSSSSSSSAHEFAGCHCTWLLNKIINELELEQNAGWLMHPCCMWHLCYCSSASAGQIRTVTSSHRNLTLATFIKKKLCEQPLCGRNGGSCLSTSRWIYVSVYYQLFTFSQTEINRIWAINPNWPLRLAVWT